MAKMDVQTPTLFFDLDGTLADPSDGITRCLRHALARLGRPVPPWEELLQYIGPSLRWTFPRLLGSDDPELIESAVAHYRQRYGTVGLFEQEIYPGIPALLQSLCDDGFALYVVTSKPRVFAEKIIEHFRLAAYFQEVFGPELNGRFDDKTELIAHMLAQGIGPPSHVVMIGDRASDILAGKANGTRTIAVTYGFGSAEELADAEPDQLCHGPTTIRDAALHALATR
jgi:phosphoglycolate phosphatase